MHLYRFVYLPACLPAAKTAVVGLTKNLESPMSMTNDEYDCEKHPFQPGSGTVLDMMCDLQCSENFPYLFRIVTSSGSWRNSKD